ncbi:hypothetical protein HRbin01_01601 [archaeon HR01]|nr:hypothetical protein HRbin01_01601 [archaeon HR01]
MQPRKIEVKSAIIRVYTGLERLHLVLAEVALELVPEEIRAHPSVRKYAARLGKKPSRMLLDRSYHHWAMRYLPDSMKRGRPDIVHFTLLEALGAPLNHSGKLRVWVSTYDGYIIEVDSRTRLPRTYERFKGLVEKLYATGGSEGLLRMRKASLQALLAEIKPDTVYLLSEEGEKIDWDSLGMMMARNEKPTVLVGAFPYSSFRPETTRLAERIFSIYDRPLEAWVVVSRLLCTLERIQK